jgi:hypothetical protein
VLCAIAPAAACAGAPAAALLPAVIGPPLTAALVCARAPAPLAPLVVAALPAVVLGAVLIITAVVWALLSAAALRCPPEPAVALGLIDVCVIALVVELDVGAVSLELSFCALDSGEEQAASATNASAADTRSRSG